MPTLPVTGGELFYRDAGAGAAVIPVHGSFSTSGLWRRLSQLLCEHYRVLALDAALSLGDRVASLALIEPVHFKLLDEAGEAEAFAEVSAMRALYVRHIDAGDLEGAARASRRLLEWRRAWDALAEDRREGLRAGRAA